METSDSDASYSVAGLGYCLFIVSDGDNHMSVSVDEAIDVFKSTIEILSKFKGKKTVKPALGKIYRTFNECIVYIIEEYESGGYEAKVLRANHCSMKLVSPSLHDTYDISKTGECSSSGSGLSVVMGLAEEVDISNL